MSRLIRENDGLSPVHLKWCSEFPSPLHHLLARSDMYRYNLTIVCSFLSRLAADNGSMTARCQQRGYPALVDEMVNHLGLVSPILQQIFFTASRRSLGVGDNGTGARMEELFLQDREQHMVLAARYNTASPPTDREIAGRNLWLKEQYLLLRNNHFQRRQSTPRILQQAVSAGTGSPAPISASCGYFQQSPTVPQFADGNNATPQSPGLAGIFQNLSHESPLPSPSVPQDTSATPVLRSNYPSTLQNTVDSGLSVSNGTPQQAVPSTIPQPHSQNNINQSSQPSVLSSIVSAGSYMQLDGPGSDQTQVPQNSAVSNSYPAAAQPSRVQMNPSNQRNYSRSHNNAPDMRLNAQNVRFVNHMPTFSSPSPTPTMAGQFNLSRPPPPHISSRGVSRADRSTYQSPSSVNLAGLLIPPHGQRLDPHPPKPDETALHQVYLRSPYLVTTDLPSEMNPGDPAQRYYQAVRDFAVGPKILSRELSVSVFEFSVPDILYSRLTRERWLSGESAASREVKRGSLQYRMRCILVKPGEAENANDLAVADTAWPASIFMEVNGVSVEVRRKIHHGKDLPVDITQFVQPASIISKNRVKVSVPRLRKSPLSQDYAFSVEIIEVLQHQQIVDKCMRSPRIPAENTINSIKASLSGSLVDDDEISMVAGDLTLNLADPFLARIFVVPVRGRGCLHRECFDLETFLNTRISKPKYPQQPSMVDVWKCPLCGKDARPYSLQVDEFLVSVRARLADQNLLDTKAIVISADGTWKPKTEAFSRKRSASQAGLDFNDSFDTDEEDNQPQKAGRTTKAKQVEIIELDDD
jgi:zinc finger MIZ domain-containing protein